MTALALGFDPPAATAEPRPSTQQLLAVEFRSTDGGSWHAIGGGPTTADAIGFALESCPDGATWIAVRWNDLYGD